MSTALRFSRIEPEQQPLLLQEIRNILNEVGAHNVEIYDQHYWDWQYKDLPSGKSYVYAAWDAERIIGYYHVPIYRCLVSGEEKLIGNIQDVAVNPTYRGVGLFRQLAEFANLDLNASDVDLIYTFPNEKSIHTFLKYNDFKLVGAVPAFVRPVRSSGIIRSKANLFGLEKLVGWIGDSLINLFSKNIKLKDATVEPINMITDEVEAVFTAYSRRFKNHLIRDRAYLNWRYLDSARGKHYILALREEGKITAVVVLKKDEMLGNPSLLIMDFAHLEEKDNSLLYLINELSCKAGLIASEFNLIFVSGFAAILPSFKQIGFIKIPEKVNPRVLNLLTRTSSAMDGTSILSSENWLLTLGDWDVF